MDIFRLHTDSNSESILETIAVPMTPEDEQGHLAASFSAAEIVLCEAESSFEQSWHNAPCRRMVIVLSGIMEIELRNGFTTQLKEGQILLAEDISGSGHKTRAKGDRPLRVAMISLD